MDERRANFVAGWQAACQKVRRSVTNSEDWLAGYDAAVSHQREGDGAEYADGYIYGISRLSMGQRNYQIEPDGDVLWA